MKPIRLFPHVWVSNLYFSIIRKSLNYRPSDIQGTNCLLLQPGISDLISLVKKTHLLRLFCAPVLLFIGVLEWFGLVSMSEASYAQTGNECKWDPQVSASSEPMALLDIFWFWNGSKHVVCLLSWPQLFCASSKELEKHIETWLLRKVKKTFVVMISHITQFDLWLKIVFHNLTLVAEFVCSVPVSASTCKWHWCYSLLFGVTRGSATFS